MSSSATQDVESVVSGVSPRIEDSVVRDLAKGTSALAAGTLIERGLGFFANVLAARLGGASTFGAYSLAMTTANSIAQYAAGGIGSTATRYSAQYSKDSGGYAALVKALAVISGVSAVIAIILLYSTSGLLAGPWLHNPGLAPILRVAAFSAGAIILLECTRGFFIGQRSLAALILLSALFGLGMIILLPLASRSGPKAMITTQAAVAGGAILVCLLLARQVGLQPATSGATTKFGPMLREIWHFGLIQLGGLVAMNLGGWWLTTLVARSDVTLAQVGLFSISQQLRNMVALAPALLSESALGLMVGSKLSSTDSEKTPARVLAICTFASVFVTVACSGTGILVMPWLLPIVYGKAYGAAVMPATLALATAVVHMGSAPASARTTVLSIRFWGWTNAGWAVLVSVLAPILIPKGGATAGVAVYLTAQALVAALLFGWLRKCDEVPAGVIPTYVCGSISILLITGLAYARSIRPALSVVTTTGIAMILIGSASLIFAMGRRNGVAPGTREIRSLLLELQCRSRLILGGLR